MIPTIATVWALVWLAVVTALTVLRARIGRPRAGAWLIVIGLVLLVFEEPALTLWIALASPATDPDGMATLVTPMAQAHLVDAAIVSLAAAAALIYIAVRGVAKQRRRAWLALAWGLAVVLVAELTTTLLVFSRGLPLPGAAGAAGRGGFGWQPVAVGLLAWSVGLAIGRGPANVDSPTSTEVTTGRTAD